MMIVSHHLLSLSQQTKKKNNKKKTERERQREGDRERVGDNDRSTETLMGCMGNGYVHMHDAQHTHAQAQRGREECFYQGCVWVRARVCVVPCRVL